MAMGANPIRLGACVVYRRVWHEQHGDPSVIRGEPLCCPGERKRGRSWYESKPRLRGIMQTHDEAR
jgi:hypothetical protein